MPKRFNVIGEWKGVQYKLCKTESTRSQALRIHVHKDVLERPDEKLETKGILFLGYTWKACVTVNQNKSVKVALRLSSPVPNTDLRRCCWMMSTPVFISGSSSPLRQNDRYGGTCPSTRTDSEGHIRFCFHMQLRSLDEDELAVDEDESDILYMLRFRPGTQKIMWADRFTFHGKDWGVQLRKTGSKRISVKVADMSNTDPILVKCHAKIIDQPTPEHSEVISLQRENRERVLSTHLPTKISKRVLSSFLQDGWLKLELRLSLPPAQQHLTENVSSSLNNSLIGIEVITDEEIREHVEKEVSVSIFDAERRKVCLSLSDCSMETVKKMIQRNVGSNSSKSTVWLWHAEKDNDYSRAVNVDTLKKLDVCLSGSNHERSSYDIDQSITFYIRSSENKTHPRRQKGSILLFCLFLDPEEKKLEYLGSIEANEDSKLYSVCNGDICGLHKKLRDIECFFFKVDSENRIIQIRTLQKTVKEFNLTSGSIVIVRPPEDDETVYSDRVHQELQDMRRDRPDNPESYHVSLKDGSFIRRDVRCVVCQKKPQTIGFYHNETVHICACEECAARVCRKKLHKCPLCEKVFKGVVSKIL